MLRSALTILLLSTSHLHAEVFEVHAYSKEIVFTVSQEAREQSFLLYTGLGSLSVAVLPGNLGSAVKVQRVGSYGSVSVARVTIAKSDSRIKPSSQPMSITIGWQSELMQTTAVLPPGINSMLNVDWCRHLASVSKPSDLVQNEHESRAWYDPTRPHARVTTRTDGIALIDGTDAVRLVPSLNQILISELVLFWRGQQQPMFVIDADGSQTLTQGDSILFRGRRPEGDTSWLDIQDSVAVFFLTSRGDTQTSRYTLASPIAKPVDTLASILVTERYELDTGYYHPGSSSNEIYGAFVTHMALFEGFYWYSLNARAGQFATIDIPFTPTGKDSVTVTADVVASTNSRHHNPDHRIVCTVNGTTQRAEVGDGYARYRMSTTLSPANAAVSVQSIRIFASDPSNLVLTPDWYSEVLIDAVEIKGQSATVAENGRLRGQVSTGNRSKLLLLENARAGAGFALDTTRNLVYRTTAGQRGVFVRGSIMPSGVSKPDSLWNGKKYRVDIAFDEDRFINNEAEGLLFIRRTIPGGAIQSTTPAGATELAQQIDALAADEIAVVVNTGTTVNEQLQLALSRRGLTVQTGQAVAWVAVLSGTRSTISAPSQSVHSVRSFVPSQSAVRSRAELALPRDVAGGIYLATGSGIERATVSPSHLAHLSADTSKVDVVVIAHSTHMQEARRWSAFRSARNGLQIRVVDVDAIFDEFDHGRHTPEALRRYLTYVWDQASPSKPTHAVLIGNATWDPRLALKGGSSSPLRPDQVPTFGKPSSDVWFGLLDDPNDVAVPELIVTRFPVLTPDECNNLVDKIIEADTVDYGAWNRRFLYAGGGETEDEGLCQIYQDVLSDPFESGILFTDPPLCLDTITVCKSTSSNPGLVIKQQLAAGIGWMNFIGHGGTEVFDITGWDPSELANDGKYGILATYSCLTGAYSNPTAASKNSQYLLLPRRGFVAAVGATGYQYFETVSQLHYNLHEVLRTTSIREIGALIYATKLGFAETNTQDGINTAYQFCILGDPFTRVRIEPSIQIALPTSGLTITNRIGSTQIRDGDDTVFIAAIVSNQGTGTDRPFTVRLRRTHNNVVDSQTVQFQNGICLDRTVVFRLGIQDAIGDHRIEIEADPDGVLGDRRGDNKISGVFTVFAKQPLILEPDEYGEISRFQPHVRVLDPVTIGVPVNLIHAVLALERDTTTSLRRSVAAEIKRTGSVVDWKPSGLAQVPDSISEIWLGVWSSEPQSNERSTVAWRRVRLVNSATINRSVHNSKAWVTARETSNIQNENGSVTLTPYQRSVSLLSRGESAADPDREPILTIRVVDSVIVSSRFRVGLNIVVLGRFDTVPRLVRRYDTSPIPSAIETGHNGYAQECLQFLRDSVLPTDRVLIAACNESFTRFVRDDLLAELKSALRGLGSRLADSLAPSSSFVMIGLRGLAPGSAIEAWKAAGNGPVSIASSLPFKAKSGRLLSNWIGPARAWDFVSINSTGKVATNIIGRYDDGSQVILATGSEWRPVGGASEIHSVRLELDLIGDDFEVDPVVDIVESEYLSAHQWVVEPDAMSISRDSVLRGDTVRAVIKVRNARTTDTTIVASLQWRSQTLTGDLVSQSTTVLPGIESDDTILIATTFSSEALPSIVYLSGVLDGGQTLRQTYTLANRSRLLLKTGEDTQRPSISARVDGKLISKTAWTSMEPRFDIRVSDNSILQVTEPSRLVVFVNGIRIRESTSTDYIFYPTISASVKWPEEQVITGVEFSFPLELGENLLIVRCSDASGNSDTAEIRLHTTTELRIGSVTVAPNPSEGPIMFFVDAVAARGELYGELAIMDLQGRLMRTVSADLPSNGGTIPWDGRSTIGEHLSSGTYHWRLLLRNPNNTVPTIAYGALIIRR